MSKKEKMTGRSNLEKRFGLSSEKNLGLSSTSSVNFVVEQNPSVKKTELMNKKNRHSLVIFICLLFFGIFSTYAQESKQRIAVIDISGDRGWEITSILTTEIVNTNKYRVVERSKIEQIIKELGLQSTQNASVRAAEIGKLLGVHKIITGETSGLWGTTSVRLIDVESGEIEAAITFQNYIYDYQRNRYKHLFSSEEIAKKIVIELLK